MRIDLPSPYGIFRAHGALIATRPRLLEAVERAVREAGTLFDWAAEHPRREAMEGRGPLFHVPGPGEDRWVVRHYRRGGMVAPVLGDRYLRVGTPRPLRELVTSEAARSRGIDTPRVLAAVVYPAGAFYRGDVAVRHVPGSTDLAGTLFHRDGPGSPARLAACRAAGRLVAELHEAGLVHADLNAKNILLRWTEDPPRPYVLDLDRCRVVSRVSVRAREGMLSRLGRSLRKFEEETGRSLPAEAWDALESAYRGAAEGRGGGGAGEELR